MVTARFLVGTSEDDAVLRVHDKIRANLRPHPDRHSRAADRRARHQRRADRGADPVADARGRGALDRQGPVSSSPTKLQAELVKVDDVGAHLSSPAAAPRADPRRAGPGEAGAVRRHAAAADRQGARRQPLLRRRAACATRGMPRTVAAGQTLHGVPDIGLLLLTTRDGRPVYVRDVAQRGRSARAPVESAGLDARPRRARRLAARAGGQPGARQARRRQRGGGVAGHPRAASTRCKGRLIPADIARRGHPRLRRHAPTTRPTSCCSISAWPRSPSWC